MSTVRKVTVTSTAMGIQILEEQGESSGRVDLTWTEARRLLRALRRAIVAMGGDAPPGE